MIHRGPDDLEPEGHIHAALEIEQLHGNMPLIVIHADHRVILPAHRLEKNGVRSDRALAPDPLRLCVRNGGHHLFQLFGAERPMLSRVRVQSGHRDSRHIQIRGQRVVRQPMTFPTRSRVTARTASAMETWVLTWDTVSLSLVSIMV